MKFSKTTGQTGLALLFCVLATACQPKDDYFLAQEFIAGEDAYCNEAKDVVSCEERADRCQPAYTMSENEDEAPQFDVCISNRHDDIPSDGGTTGSGTTTGGTTGGDGSTTGGTDGSATGGTTGSVTGGTTGSTTGTTDGGATAGSTTGGTTGDSGSTTGSTNGGTTGGTTGSTGGTTGSTDPDSDLPTIEEAYNANCTNVPAEHMWVKTNVDKKGNKTESKKVKICHFSGNGSQYDSHSVVIACPALKAHIQHQAGQDYIGACKL